jgi:hypothetical protein
LPLKASIARF